MLRQCICLLLTVQVSMACLAVTTPTGEENLVAKQFKEDGCISSPLDILSVIDGSGSVTAPNFELTKQFFVDLTQQIEGDHHFAALQFSRSANKEFDFLPAAEAEVAFSNIVYQTGSTHVGKALTLAEEMLADASNRGQYPDVLLLTIDGPHNGPNDPVPIATRIRNTGVTLIVVAIGSNVDTDQVESYVEDPSMVIKGEFDTLSSKVLQALKLLICPTA